MSRPKGRSATSCFFPSLQPECQLSRSPEKCQYAVFVECLPIKFVVIKSFLSLPINSTRHSGYMGDEGQGSAGGHRGARGSLLEIRVLP